MRWLITQSLISSWRYMLSEYAPFNALEEFTAVLNRVPRETSEAAQKGIEFEDVVTALLNGDRESHTEYKHLIQAEEVASILEGAQLQVSKSKSIVVDGLELVVYGRFDALKAGTIYDIKFPKSYEVGKYYSSVQHPIYMEIEPDVVKFEYLIATTKGVYKETYRRDEIRPATTIIAEFIEWLSANNMLDIYKSNWESRYAA